MFLMKINDIRPQDSTYLQILGSIAKPPKSLRYMGTLPDRRYPTVAVVGTRKPTAYGREVTERLSRDLASRGVIIVSGLALGIDAIAHQATLDARGTTIAILANQLPDIRPASNRLLGERIISEGGAILIRG